MYKLYKTYRSSGKILFELHWCVVYGAFHTFKNIEELWRSSSVKCQLINHTKIFLNYPNNYILHTLYIVHYTSLKKNYRLSWNVHLWILSWLNNIVGYILKGTILGVIFIRFNFFRVFFLVSWNFPFHTNKLGRCFVSAFKNRCFF